MHRSSEIYLGEVDCRARKICMRNEEVKVSHELYSGEAEAEATIGQYRESAPIGRSLKDSRLGFDNYESHALCGKRRQYRVAYRLYVSSRCAYHSQSQDIVQTPRDASRVMMI